MSCFFISAQHYGKQYGGKFFTILLSGMLIFRYSNMASLLCKANCFSLAGSSFFFFHFKTIRLQVVESNIQNSTRKSINLTISKCLQFWQTLQLRLHWYARTSNDLNTRTPTLPNLQMFTNCYRHCNSMNATWKPIPIHWTKRAT